LHALQPQPASADKDRAMNVYTELLFLHGHVADANLAASFGRSYGNRVATDRALRERWERGERTASDGREDDIDSAPKAA
jgi:hypothetical protein